MENKKDKVTLNDDNLDQVAGGRDVDWGPITCLYDPECIYFNTDLCHLDLCPYIQAR